MTDDTSSRTVFVVTLGTGPRRTATWLHDLVAQYNIDTDFRFITIESTDVSSGDIPDEFLNIPLDTDSRVRKRFDRAKQDPDVPYLNDEHTLMVQGATRNPAVGRFLLEYHSRRVYEMLSEEFSAAVDPNDSELSVWLLASLSGGTGAGTFPLVSTMVDQIAGDIGGRHNIDVYQNGLATASELRADNLRLSPNGVTDYFVNTNNSLQALSTLLQLPDAHGRPQVNGPTRLEMPVAPDPAAADGLLNPTFEISEPPMDALFLAPIDEDRTDDGDWNGDERTSYLARLNYMLASTVLALTTTSGDNDLGNLYNKQLANQLYTIDTASVRASVDPALQLLEVQRDHERVSDELDVLNGHVEALERLVGQLTELRSTQIDAGSVPEVAMELSSQLAGRSSQIVDQVSSLTLPDASFEEISTQADLALTDVPAREVGPDPLSEDPHENAVSDFASDQFIPHATVGRYVFLKMVLARLVAELNTHEFTDRVQDLWQKNEAELEEEYPGLVDANAETQYEQAIEPFLAAHQSELEDQLEACSIIAVRKRSRLREQIASLEATREELSQLFHEYTQLQERRDRLAESELPALGSELETMTNTVAGAHQTCESLRDAKRAHLNTLTQQQSSLHDRLTTPMTGRITEIPLAVDSTESLSPESFSDATSLFDLVDSGLIERDHILRGVNRAMGLLEEPLEDNFHEQAENQPQRVLIPMTNAENTAVLSMDGVTQPSMGSIIANNDVNTQLDTGIIDTPFQVDFVMLHGNVRLANSSEYRVIRERWENDQSHQLFGESVDLSHQLAYPELVPALSFPAPQSTDDDTDGSGEQDADGEVTA